MYNNRNPDKRIKYNYKFLSISIHVWRTMQFHKVILKFGNEPFAHDTHLINVNFTRTFPLDNVGYFSRLILTYASFSCFTMTFPFDNVGYFTRFILIHALFYNDLFLKQFWLIKC